MMVIVGRLLGSVWLLSLVGVVASLAFPNASNQMFRFSDAMFMLTSAALTVFIFVGGAASIMWEKALRGYWNAFLNEKRCCSA